MFTALSAFLNQVACQLLPPIIVSLLLSLELVLTFMLQYTVLASIHPGHRNWVEVLGAIMVLVANAISPVVMMYSKCTAKTRAEDQESLPIIKDQEHDVSRK